MKVSFGLYISETKSAWPKQSPSLTLAMPSALSTASTVSMKV